LNATATEELSGSPSYTTSTDCPRLGGGSFENERKLIRSHFFSVLPLRDISFAGDTSIRGDSTIEAAT
jgi:hypothetical protein